MPRGRKPKERPQVVPDAQVQPVEETVTLSELNRSMMVAVSKELADGNQKISQEIIDALPDYLDTLNRLATGIVIQGTKFDNNGEPHTFVYSVPPFWPALKYLLEWSKKLRDLTPAQAPQTQRIESGIDAETRKFLAEFVGQPGQSMMPALRLPVPRTGGVVVLSDESTSNAEANNS
jgi:hypothetical protein